MTKWENYAQSSYTKIKCRGLPASGDFPTLLVQGHDYCAHLSWFTGQLKKLAVMFLPLLRVFLSNYNPLHFLGLLALQAVRQTYPKVFGVAILQDGFFQGLKPSSDVAHCLNISGCSCDYLSLLLPRIYFFFITAKLGCRDNFWVGSWTVIVCSAAVIR